MTDLALCIWVIGFGFTVGRCLDESPRLAVALKRVLPLFLLWPIRLGERLRKESERRETLLRALHPKVRGTDEAWESRKLGAEEAFVAVVEQTDGR